MNEIRGAIVTCFPINDEQQSAIRRNCPNHDVLVSDQENIARDLFEAEIFLGHAKVPVDWEAVTSFGKLKWIQSTAAGLDHCLVSPVVNSNIIVSGCSALFSKQVAEQTIALLFYGVRNLSTFAQAQLDQQYIRRPTDTIHDKVVGIVGFGGNGRQIARYLAPMCKKIIATDLFPSFGIPKKIDVFPVEKTDELFRHSDVLIITLPLTESTKNFVDSRLLSLLKSDAYFINVARGGVVDHIELERKILANEIRFAGLDVFDPEPVPIGSRIWTAPNVLLTPHVGAQSASRIPMTIKLFTENYRRFEIGKPLINLVDKRLGFPRPENRVKFDDDGEISIPLN